MRPHWYNPACAKPFASCALGINEERSKNQARDTARAFQAAIVQHIDAAAFQLYANYTHSELDRSTSNGVDQNFKDLDVVMIGGILKF